MGRVELGMENIREFPIFDLVWNLEGLIAGVFLKFEGTQGIMRLDSHKSVEELQDLRAQFQAQLPIGFKVQALQLDALPEAWADLVALYQNA